MVRPLTKLGKKHQLPTYKIIRNLNLLLQGKGLSCRLSLLCLCGVLIWGYFTANSKS